MLESDLCDQQRLRQFTFLTLSSAKVDCANYSFEKVLLPSNQIQALFYSFASLQSILSFSALPGRCLLSVADTPARIAASFQSHVPSCLVFRP